MISCEECINYVYDEETDCYECIVAIDMDETERILRRGTKACPFFRFDNEYKTVNKQI